MDGDGGNAHAITAGTGLVSGLAWSPDGTRIAVVAVEPEWANTEIFVGGADGSGFAQLTPTSQYVAAGYHVAWSPDGATLAFLRRTFNEQKICVCTLPPTGGPARIVAELPADRSQTPYLSWSPDGAQIAFEYGGDIYVTDLTGVLRNLTNSAEAEYWPTWSPDGAMIAFVRGSDIWTMSSADGSGASRITSDPGAEFFPFWLAAP